MINSSTTFIGKTPFELIEDYLPLYNNEAETQSKKIENIFRSSQPIPIPLKRKLSSTSSEKSSESPRIISFEFSPKGKPICHLYNEACKRKPYGDIIKCSKKITS